MGNDQTLADCAETDLLAFFEDDEMESVMERASVGLLEAAEAMAKCHFAPRKALSMIESQKNAELAAEKKAAEQACSEKIEEQEKNNRERKDAEENEQRKTKREQAKLAAYLVSRYAKAAARAARMASENSKNSVFGLLVSANTRG
jgi:hypothetical protein